MENIAKPNYKNAINAVQKILDENYIYEPPVVAQELAISCGLKIVSVNFSDLGSEYNNISGFIDSETK